MHRARGKEGLPVDGSPKAIASYIKWRSEEGFAWLGGKPFLRARRTWRRIQMREELRRMILEDR